MAKKKLSHINKDGRYVMVDVSNKPDSLRTASAWGEIKVNKIVIDLIKQNKIHKGNVLRIAELAGITGAKKTGELIPLCHNLYITKADCVAVIKNSTTITVESSVTCIGKTGVEMEALTGVSVALLTIWDMVKSAEKDKHGQYPVTRIEGIHVVEKKKGV